MSKKNKIITTIVGLLAIATTALMLFLDSAFDRPSLAKSPTLKSKFSLSANR